MKCEGDLEILDANRIMYEHEQLKQMSGTDRLNRALQMTRILILPRTLLPPHPVLTHPVANLGRDGVMALPNQMAFPESTLHSRPLSQQPRLILLI